MMLYPALIALGMALIFLGVQVLWAWRLAACYPPPNTPAPPDEDLPRAAVVLSVRGADPSLVDCLHGLLQQDYPDYKVHIVIDSEHDPAWELLRPLLDDEAAARVHVRVLETKYATCSLKVSGTVQAIGDLDAEVRVVVLIDADVIPYAHWLRDLVRPLRDPGVGATSGVRWFLPETDDWGSLVRGLWNAAACSQMFAFRIPWAGSLAFRAELFRDSDLLDQWKRCFCEDTMSYGALRRLGLRVCFVPAATMVNPERIALKSCYSFIRRQLLTVRLHHPCWPLVRVTGVGAGLTLLLLLAVSVTSLGVGDFLSAGLTAGALAAFVAGMASALLWIDTSLRRMARKRGVRLPASLWWKLALAGPLTQGIYVAALVSVSFLRKVDWRGITYELYDPTPVRLTAYHPYRAEVGHADGPVSVV